MTKKFTESIFILLILNLLVKPFWIFAIDRSIQNRVGADQYGLYFSLFSFSLLFNIIADLGITNYNNRNIAQHHHLIAQQVERIIPIKLLLGLIYTIITLMAGLFIGYSGIQLKLLIWLSVNQILISTTQYLRSNISGLQLFKTDSLVSISDKFFLVIICSYLLWWSTDRTFRIEWLIYSQTAAYGTSMLIALFIVLRKSGKIVFHFKAKKAVITLKQSFPFAVLIFLMVFYTRIDAVMLERMLPDGKTQTGIYAQAFRILDALSMFAFLFASILLPLFAKMIKQKETIHETLGHSFALLMVPSLGLLAAIFFNADDFMQTLYIQHVNESSEVLKLLMIGFIGISASYIFGTLLTAAGHLKTLNRIALAAVLLNIVLNALLIPDYGSWGAAFSSMLTQVMMGVLQGIISIVHFKIKVRALTLVKYGLILVGSIAIAALISHFIKPWYVSFVSIPMLAIIGGFSFNILKINNFKNLFLNKGPS